MNAAHRHRVLAINMKHGNLEAFAGEQLAATGVVRGVDESMGTIHTPTIVAVVAAISELARKAEAPLPKTGRARS